VLTILRVLLRAVCSSFQTQRGLALENLALRHQLAVLQRRAPQRAKVAPVDRVIWAWISRSWNEWQQALVFVKPATVLRWHRRGFRLFWARRSRAAGGRPAAAREVVSLIRSMSRANPLWGAPRIHGELAKIGIEAAQSTVARYMIKHREPPSPTWRAFLKNHLDGIAAIDFFTVPTATFRVLFVFVVLAHDRRRILHVNVTANPSAEWTARQIVNAFPGDCAPKYLLRDRDAIYGSVFRERVTRMGIEHVPTAPRSPWQNPYVERVIGSIRQECLDHVIVLGENHLRRAVRSYVAYYNEHRTHLALTKDSPTPRPIEMAGKVIAMPQVGGLHHRYTRLAA
jgi:transposase InsO family protein